MHQCGQQQDAQTTDMKQWQGHLNALSLPELKQVLTIFNIDLNGKTAEQHTLWATGGAGRVNQKQGL